MGMFPLGQDCKRAQGSPLAAPALLITTYQERLCASGSEIQTKTAVVAGL